MPTNVNYKKVPEDFITTISQQAFNRNLANDSLTP